MKHFKIIAERLGSKKETNVFSTQVSSKLRWRSVARVEREVNRSLETYGISPIKLRELNNHRKVKVH